MSAQILLLDRVEFSTIKVETNQGEFGQDSNFPQLAIPTESIKVLTRSDLAYPANQASDPRTFMLLYGVKIAPSAEAGESTLPYEIEVEAIGYFRYVGGDEFAGEDRFRAVRLSGYQILYGAIREMVANLTARGRHGTFHLPARNFGGVAKARAEDDEKRRQELLSKSTTKQIENTVPEPKKAAKRSPKKSTKSSE